MGGVWVYKEAGGLFEDNDIYANAKAAVRVYDYGNPTVCLLYTSPSPRDS